MPLLVKRASNYFYGNKCIKDETEKVFLMKLFSYKKIKPKKIYRASESVE